MDLSWTRLNRKFRDGYFLKFEFLLLIFADAQFDAVLVRFFDQSVAMEVRAVRLNLAIGHTFSLDLA